MPRTRVPLTFGAGLDRATGQGVKDARTLTNARNVIPREAGLDLRPGLSGSGLPAHDWGTDVVAIHAVEQTKDALQVVFDRTTRDLRVYRFNPVSPPTRQLVGTWGTLNVAALFPVITTAEVGGRVYLAHAEDSLAFRLVTKVWTPGAADTDAGGLTNASSDLDGNGTAGDIFFYGVCAWRQYVVGWGWGTEADTATKDRREIVRFSAPDNPLVFPPELYFLAGTQSQRILGCVPTPTHLLCCSRTQRHTIYGTDPDTFGIDLTDPVHGMVSPRAGYTIDGVAYTWATSGPRVTREAMQPSVDLSLALDLLQAVPADWPTMGPERQAFTGYDHEQRVLYWAWPDLLSTSAPQTRAFSLSLRTTDAPRFTVAVFERRLASAGRVLSGKVPAGASTGYASDVTMEDGPFAGNGRPLTIAWVNNFALGNETVEVWLKQTAGGVWALQASLAIAGTTGATTIPEVESLMGYDAAIRLRSLDNTFTAGYEGATPDDWTALTAPDSKASLVTGAAAPIITSGTWKRYNASPTNGTAIELKGTYADKRLVMRTQKFVGGAWVDTYVLVDTAVATQHPWVSYPEVPDTEIGLTIPCRVRLERDAAFTAWSNTMNVVCKVTVVPPPILETWDASSASSTSAVRKMEVWARDAGYPMQFREPATGAILTPATSTPIGVIFTSTLTGTGNINVEFRIGVTVDGVTDWSEWQGYAGMTVHPGTAFPPSPIPKNYTTPKGNFNEARVLPREFTGPSLDNQYIYAVRDFGNGFYEKVASYPPDILNIKVSTNVGGLGPFTSAFAIAETYPATRRRSVHRSI